MTPQELKEWIAERARKDEALYERYGKPLEPEHTGRFVAIGDTGEVILGDDEFALSKESLNRFGSGKYTVRRIGYDYNIRWRTVFP